MTIMSQPYRSTDKHGHAEWRVAPLCRALVQQIEELLEQRRANRTRWRGPKTWTQSEFCREAYSSYKCLRAGTVRYPPRREVILQIAEYLECSFDQRNALLLAAGYVPELSAQSDVMLDWALELARRSIEDMPMPAYVITDDWRLAGANTYLARLFGPSIADAWRQERDYLRLLFDPALPVRGWLSHYAGCWDQLVDLSLTRFKADFLDSATPENRRRIELLMDLPGFALCWQRQQQPPTAHEQPQPLKLRLRTGAPIHVYVAQVRICSQRYPHVLTLMPADECSQQRMVECAAQHR